MELNLPKQRVALKPASIWRRAIAFAIDMLFLEFTILSPFSMLLSKIIPEGYGIMNYAGYIQDNPHLINTMYFVAFFAMVPVILYFAILEYKLGQTIGKMILNIAVLPETKERRFWQYLVRSIELIPLPPFIFLLVADPLLLILRGQRLSEMLSRTNTYERIIM